MKRLGYTYEEFMALENRERIHPEDKAKIEALSQEIYKSGFTESEYRVQHKNGHYIHMSSKSVLLQRIQN